SSPGPVHHRIELRIDHAPVRGGADSPAGPVDGVRGESQARLVLDRSGGAGTRVRAFSREKTPPRGVMLLRASRSRPRPPVPRPCADNGRAPPPDVAGAAREIGSVNRWRSSR